MSSTTSSTPTTTTDGSTFTTYPASPSPSSGKGGGTSTSLYLFTFLATLFLLLFVSSAIILRSFVLRRRFRRRIEEAILAGVMTPNEAAHRGRRRNFGAKPKMWEAWVSPGGDAGSWASIMPVSVQPESHNPAQQSASPSVDAAPDGPAPPLHRRLLRNPFSRRPPAEPPRPPTPPRAETSPVSPAAAPDGMLVSVLIAMPDARRSHMGGGLSSAAKKGESLNSNWEYEEDELPDMVLGVARLSYREDTSSVDAGVITYWLH
ncbi:hypothetical protein BV25DRAFT_742912 [Artomyces pyxidatus]|uniref:Uncharacterized protein n=1 Tax=Artomyces pyxidatus TaxID=48021 RepID=A0ACB8SZU7_9AGAM|nr:hypothetical protein BV25DRAFT_742912 [Artomyces pyxidatus]